MNWMPKRKEPELDPKEQFKRFQETAKEVGADDTEGRDRVEAAFRKLTTKAKAHTPRTKRDS